jgi:hypothetical protein
MMCATVPPSNRQYIYNVHFAKERCELILDTLSPQSKINVIITPTTPTIKEACEDATSLQSQFCFLLVEEPKICIAMHILFTSCIYPFA